MPNWKQILSEMQAHDGAPDAIRRRYLHKLQQKTGRNVVVYYSGWLQKGDLPNHQVSDLDKNGLMTTFHKLDRSKGLDLVLHTPGGEVAATESIVEYLRAMFGTNVRAIVPQLALSAGTMIACACQEVIMGYQSSLGPIDPQVGNVPAHGVLEEFKEAHRQVKDDPSKIPVWQPIIARYGPAFLGECQKAVDWAEEMAREWLVSGMFADDKDAKAKARSVVKELGDHALTKSHRRHLSCKRCRDIGLKVKLLEDDAELQDAVLSVHHACMLTFESTPAYKFIENHEGTAYVLKTPQQK
jgi:hypothetical protein